MSRSLQFALHVRAILQSGLRWGFLTALALAAPVPAANQAQRLHPRILRTRPELVCVLCYLTVSAAPSAVSFTLVKGGIAAGSAPVVITTTLYGVSALSSLSLYGYFSSPSAALTDGQATPDNIPTSAVLGEVPTGAPTSFNTFTQSGAVGTAGAGLLLFTTSSLASVGCIPISAFCRTDSLSLEINLAALPQLPAGTYTGTLILEAEAL